MHYVVLLDSSHSKVCIKQITTPSSNPAILAEIIEQNEDDSTSEIPRLTDTPVVFPMDEINVSSFEEKQRIMLLQIKNDLEETQEQRDNKFYSLKSKAQTESVSEDDSKTIKEIENEREIQLFLLRDTKNLSPSENSMLEQLEKERDTQLQILREKAQTGQELSNSEYIKLRKLENEREIQLYSLRYKIETNQLSSLESSILENLEKDRDTQLQILRKKAQTGQELSNSEYIKLRKLENEREIQLYLLRYKIETNPPLYPLESSILERIENERDIQLQTLRKKVTTDKLSDSEIFLLEKLESEEPSHVYTLLSLQREKVRRSTHNKEEQAKLNELHSLLKDQLVTMKWQLSPEQIIGLSKQYSLEKNPADKKAILKLKLLAEHVLLINNAIKEKTRLQNKSYWFSCASEKIQALDAAIQQQSQDSVWKDTELLKNQLKGALAIKRYQYWDNLFKRKDSKSSSYVNAVQLPKLMNQDPHFHRQIKKTLASFTGYFSGKSKKLEEALSNIENPRTDGSIEQKSNNVKEILKESSCSIVYRSFFPQSKDKSNKHDQPVAKKYSF